MILITRVHSRRVYPLKKNKVKHTAYGGIRVIDLIFVRVQLFNSRSTDIGYILSSS